MQRPLSKIPSNYELPLDIYFNILVDGNEREKTYYTMTFGDERRHKITLMTEEDWQKDKETSTGMENTLYIDLKLRSLDRINLKITGIGKFLLNLVEGEN